MLVVLSFAGVRHLGRSVCSTVKPLFNRHHLDGLTFVFAAFLRHDLGVHVSYPQANSDRFRPAVHANELFKRTPTTGVAELLAEPFIEAFL